MTTAVSRRATIQSVDPLWTRLRADAEALLAAEPALSSFILATILQQPSLEASVVHRIAQRLDHADLPAELIRQAFAQALAEDPGIAEAIRADILAVLDRDPAANRLMSPCSISRVSMRSRRIGWPIICSSRGGAISRSTCRAAPPPSSRSTSTPRPVLGKGLFFDHATGIVIGETVVIEDDVSILQDVTLGGTGKELGDRHPKIRRGVLIGAGAKILGNIEVGHCARVAAGSVVLTPVPHNTTVAGVPARVVGEAGCAEPARSMIQILESLPD